MSLPTGQWSACRFQHQPVILEARQAYLGQEEDRLASRADQLEEFVHYVKGEITKVVGKQCLTPVQADAAAARLNSSVSWPKHFVRNLGEQRPTWFKVVAVWHCSKPCCSAVLHFSDLRLSHSGRPRRAPPEAQQALYAACALLAIVKQCNCRVRRALGSIGLLLRKKWAFLPRSFTAGHSQDQPFVLATA